jgi:Mrp family chromosome partitioning ATPase
VTSGDSGDGKTVTAINLALGLTIAGNRVVLVEADLRHPKVAQHLGLRRDAGLSTVLSENGKNGRNGTSFMDVLQPVNVPAFVPPEIRGRLSVPRGNGAGHRAGRGAGAAGDAAGDAVADGLPSAALFCLGSGPLPPNPAEVLGSGRMEALLRELAADDMVDYVVIDSAPILSVADALVIAPKVDAVLVAARLNRVTRDKVQQVNEQLGRTGARVIGLVVGGVRVKPSPYYRQSTTTATAKG